MQRLNILKNNRCTSKCKLMFAFEQYILGLCSNECVLKVYPRHMPTTIFHNSEIIFFIIVCVSGELIIKLFSAHCGAICCSLVNDKCKVLSVCMHFC